MRHLIIRAWLAGSVAALSITAIAQEQTAPAASAPSAMAAEMADGEVRKIDLENKKITLRHGVIKSMNMPPMSMVFVIKEPAQLANIKAGDKVKFLAEKIDGAFVVTTIVAAP